MSATEEIAKLRQEVDTNRAAVSAIQAMFNAEGGKNPRPQQAALSKEDREMLDRLARSQSQLSDRMAGLESALATTPEKAVALPLLRQQVTDAQDRARGDMDGVRSEIGRLFTMVQWAFTLIVTVILGLAGLMYKRTDKLRGSDDKEPSALSEAKS